MSDIRIAKIEPWANEVQVHIFAGCSDARDVSPEFNRIKDEKTEEAKRAGNLIDIERINIPGVFATREIIAEIKTLIIHKAKEYSDYEQAGRSIEFFVHMMAHGDARLKEGHSHDTFSYHDIEVNSRAIFNCGMMHARNVAMDLETILLAEKPTLTFGVNGKTQNVRIQTEFDIENFMKLSHGHNGTIAGNWVIPIGDLRTHPYAQKKILRDAIDRDADLRHLQIHITAGVQNYRTNEYFRVDGNTQHLTIIDDIYTTLRSAAPDNNRVSTQKPEILLFHHSGVRDARQTASEIVLGKDYNAGTVFAIGGVNAADHFRLFGPYKMIGFFYSARNLNLDKWVVLGRDREEAKLMLTRLGNDPLVGFTLRYFNIKPEMAWVDKKSFPHAVHQRQRGASDNRLTR